MRCLTVLVVLAIAMLMWVAFIAMASQIARRFGWL